MEPRSVRYNFSINRPIELELGYHTKCYWDGDLLISVRSGVLKSLVNSWYLVMLLALTWWSNAIEKQMTFCHVNTWNYCAWNVCDAVCWHSIAYFELLSWDEMLCTRLHSGGGGASKVRAASGLHTRQVSKWWMKEMTINEWNNPPVKLIQFQNVFAKL